VARFYGPRCRNQLVEVSRWFVDVRTLGFFEFSLSHVDAGEGYCLYV